MLEKQQNNKTTISRYKLTRFRWKFDPASSVEAKALRHCKIPSEVFRRQTEARDKVKQRKRSNCLGV